MSAKPQQFVAEVKNQYEELPYPYRDAEKERESLHFSDPNSLDALNHFGWGGKRDLRTGRFLVAGGGTGDAAIYFAEQLRGTDAQLVYLDLSSASLSIAQARAKKRGLTNIRFEHRSILDLPDADLGQFDVIQCSGVLHHLADPDEGLRALASVLTPDGIMSIMVYAQYGRMAVYQIQELMRRLVPANATPAEKLAAARAFLNNMPNTHWFLKYPAPFMADIQWPDGSGIYDLFLHSTDRAYTVPQIYEWLDQAALQLTSFYAHHLSDMFYQPETYTQDPTLLALVKDKTPRERHAIAELMNDSMLKHSFYAAKEVKIPAQFADDLVICWSAAQSMLTPWYKIMQDGLNQAQPGQGIQEPDLLRPHVPRLVISRGATTHLLFHAIDSRRTIGEIVVDVAGKAGVDAAPVRAELERLYRELFHHQRVYLRHPSVPPYVTAQEIKDRLPRYPEIL